MSTVGRSITHQNHPDLSSKPVGAALVSVGVPTFNRPDGLDRTLSCITAQSYPWLEIIVSDNCSPDPRVAEVAERYVRRDARVRYFRQDSNQGPYANFRFVLERAKGEYFMWAADDDLWEPDFVAQLVRELDADTATGLAFCNFEAMNAEGNRLDRYPDFLPLLQEFTGLQPATRLARFIRQNESLGKANLIYGLFRRNVLLAVGGVKHRALGGWGDDMLLICSVLARADVRIVSSLLYRVGGTARPDPTSADYRSVVATMGTRLVARLRGCALRAGYYVGYFPIVVKASPLQWTEKIALLGTVIMRWLISIFRDCISLRLRRGERT